MNKKLVFALTLAVVLVSGAFAGAMAECVPSCVSCACAAPVDKDYDTACTTCQGAYPVGPTVPEYFGSTGAGGG